MFTVCPKCGYMYDDSTGGCPQCSGALSNQSNIPEKEIFINEDTINAYDMSFNVAITEPVEEAIPEPIQEYSAPAVSCESLIEETGEEATEFITFDDSTIIDAPVTSDDYSVTFEETEIVTETQPQVVAVEEIAPEFIAPVTEDIIVPIVEETIDPVITIDDTYDRKPMYSEYAVPQQPVEDISSSSFDVDPREEINIPVQPIETATNTSVNVDTTYTIVNNNNYVQPIIPVQTPTVNNLPAGYTPVTVAPMVYSTPDVTTPKKNGKYGIIILVAALLAIVVAGGVILELL